MTTECNQREFDFQALGSRGHGRIRRRDDHLRCRRPAPAGGGGQDRAAGRLAPCFADHRDPDLIEHTVDELLTQRVFALALGYEDLNDHDPLRHDPLLAVLVGKADPTGQERVDPRDRGKSLAGKSTFNRLELTPAGRRREEPLQEDRRPAPRHRIVLRGGVSAAHPQPPAEIVLDFDATDDPIHGHQLGRFFHGYYDHYCYLPLYIFCGEHLLCAKLRPSDIDAAAGSVKAVGADRRADSPRLAQGADHRAWRQRFLPREPDALVRREPRGLRVRLGEKHAV